MNLLRQLQGLWRELARAGVDESSTPIKASRIILTNKVAMTGALIGLLYIPIYIYARLMTPVANQVIIIMVCFGVVVLNRRGKTVLARQFGLFFGSCHIFVYLLIFPFETAMYMYFIPLCAMPFLIFSPDQVRHRRIAMAWPILFYILYFGLYPYTAPLPLPESWVSILRQLSFVGSWFLTVTQLIYFNSSMYTFEQQFLKTANELKSELKERIAAEAQVHDQRMTIAAQARNSELGIMAGSIAHEIRSPLSIVRGMADKLSALLSGTGDIDRQKLDKTLNSIQNSTKRIVKVVDGMQIIGRDGSKDPMVAVPLSRIIGYVKGVCSDRLRIAEIEIHIDEFAADLHILCREAQIAQVLINLFNNAVDALSDAKSKWIKLEVRDSKRGLSIAVTNSGDRIDPEIAKKAFLPFFTTKDVGKGTGLGLSISKTILHEHGGDLILDDNSPQTSFVLHFPKSQDLAA